jgi:hypothetical protein
MLYDAKKDGYGTPVEHSWNARTPENTGKRCLAFLFQRCAFIENPFATMLNK